MPDTSKPAIVMETLLFDLDGTLYPLDNGYHTHVVSEKLGVILPSTTWSSCAVRGAILGKFTSFATEV